MPATKNCGMESGLSGELRRMGRRLEQKKTKKKEDTKRLEELKQNSNNSYLESQVNKPKEQDRVTKEIKAMVKKQKLLEEDLMGIKVDAFV